MEFTHEQISEIISEITNGESGLQGLVSQAMSHWYHKNVSAQIFFGIKWTIYRFFGGNPPERKIFTT